MQTLLNSMVHASQVRIGSAQPGTLSNLVISVSVVSAVWSGSVEYWHAMSVSLQW